MTCEKPCLSLLNLERVWASGEVRWRLRFAAVGMVRAQCGPSFVAGAAATAGFLAQRLTCCTTRNTQNATMRKFTTVQENTVVQRGGMHGFCSIQRIIAFAIQAEKKAREFHLANQLPDGRHQSIYHHRSNNFT